MNDIDFEAGGKTLEKFYVKQEIWVDQPLRHLIEGKTTCGKDVGRWELIIDGTGGVKLWGSCKELGRIGGKGLRNNWKWTLGMKAVNKDLERKYGKDLK